MLEIGDAMLEPARRTRCGSDRVYGPGSTGSTI
jgi:hypothetical protein